MVLLSLVKQHQIHERLRRTKCQGLAIAVFATALQIVAETFAKYVRLNTQTRRNSAVMDNTATSNWRKLAHTYSNTDEMMELSI